MPISRPLRPVCSNSFRSSAPRSCPLFPDGSDQRNQVLSGDARAQRLSQINALLGVETQIPHTIGREAAAIACRAEWRSRGRNDPERRSIGKPKALRRGRTAFNYRFDRAISFREIGKYGPRDKTFSADQSLAPPTSIYSINRTSASTCLPYSINAPSSSSLNPRMATYQV